MDLNHVFKYHAPTPEQIEKYQAIRDAAHILAASILTNCPPCADRAAALRKVREAVMTANASIALGGRLE